MKKIHCVIGFSMGGQQVRAIDQMAWCDGLTFSQAYYWPVMYPDYVERSVMISPLCVTALLTRHNQIRSNLRVSADKSS